jgi:hypothetical protein
VGFTVDEPHEDGDLLCDGQGEELEDKVAAAEAIPLKLPQVLAEPVFDGNLLAEFGERVGFPDRDAHAESSALPDGNTVELDDAAAERDDKGLAEIPEPLEKAVTDGLTVLEAQPVGSTELLHNTDPVGRIVGLGDGSAHADAWALKEGVAEVLNEAAGEREGRGEALSFALKDGPTVPLPPEVPLAQCEGLNVICPAAEALGVGFALAETAEADPQTVEEPLKLVILRVAATVSLEAADGDAEAAPLKEARPEGEVPLSLGCELAVALFPVVEEMT